MRHLEQLGIAALQVTPDPVRVATEGALWGAVSAHGFLNEAVIVSDDAGQFNVGAARAVLDPRRAAGAQAGDLHRPAARRPAASSAG